MTCCMRWVRFLSAPQRVLGAAPCAAGRHFTTLGLHGTCSFGLMLKNAVGPSHSGPDGQAKALGLRSWADSFLAEPLGWCHVKF